MNLHFLPEGLAMQGIDHLRSQQVSQRKRWHEGEQGGSGGSAVCLMNAVLQGKAGVRAWANSGAVGTRLIQNSGGIRHGTIAEGALHSLVLTGGPILHAAGGAGR